MYKEFTICTRFDFHSVHLTSVNCVLFPFAMKLVAFAVLLLALQALNLQLVAAGGCPRKVYWETGQASSVSHDTKYGCISCSAASCIGKTYSWSNSISVTATFCLSVEVVSASLSVGYTTTKGGSVSHTCSKNDLPAWKGNIICLRTTVYPVTLRGKVVHQRTKRCGFLRLKKCCRKETKHVTVKVYRKC